MFKIRKKKKGAQPMDQDLQPMEGVQLTVRCALNAVTTLLRCQVILAECQAKLPSLRAALTLLLDVQMSLPLVTLVDHARQHGMITDVQAAQLLNGRPIEIEKESHHE